MYELGQLYKVQPNVLVYIFISITELNMGRGGWGEEGKMKEDSIIQCPSNFFLVELEMPIINYCLEKKTPACTIKGDEITA